jgi:hypothetical protein
MAMTGLRRKDDAMKTDAGIQTPIATQHVGVITAN